MFDENTPNTIWWIDPDHPKKNYGSYSAMKIRKEEKENARPKVWTKKQNTAKKNCVAEIKKKYCD